MDTFARSAISFIRICLFVFIIPSFLISYSSGLFNPSAKIQKYLSYRVRTRKLIWVVHGRGQKGSTCMTFCREV
jgi:hypothetical protein